MSNLINVNHQNYPQIIITVKGEPTEVDVVDFEKVMINLLNNSEGKFIVISDQTNAKFMSAKVRIQLGKALQNISGKYKDREEAVIVINPSAIGKMMIKGIQLLINPSKKFFVVTTLEEAIDKAKEIQYVHH